MSEEPGKVIVVEDEEMVRINLEDFLTDDGFEVVSASTAEEALEIIKENQFDVAVVDIRLPKMDGDSLIKAVHGIQPGMRFVIHTGSPHFSLSRELEELGITRKHLFLKPISDMGILSQAVKELVEEAGT